jgi:hypothetical protein
MDHRLDRVLSSAVLAVLPLCCGCRSTPPAPTVVPISSYDEFNKDLATRVADFLVPGGARDFQVVVTPAADPIGTLYRQGRSVPFDDAACVAPNEPPSRNMPSVFPSYQLSRKLAADLGLDETILRGLSSAGATVSDESSFAFSVLNPQLKVLSDRVVQATFSRADCAQAIGHETLLIVRGYVIGQRKFSTGGNATGRLNVGVAKVGKFDIEGGGGSSLNITDEAPSSFLQIRSEVVPAPTSATVATLAVPQPLAGLGSIYVQQDRADDPGRGKNVVAALKNSGFKVESHIEATSSARTPDDPQVRYFNDTDKSKATSVLESLQERYPSAKLVPMKIPAPAGQVEVWLPRVKP